MSDITKRYVRKPEPIFAIKMTEENALEAALWCGGQLVTNHATLSEKPFRFISAHFGASVRKNAVVGDYIIQYTSGKFGVMDAKHFERAYEEAPVHEPS